MRVFIKYSYATFIIIHILPIFFPIHSKGKKHVTLSALNFYFQFFFSHTRTFIDICIPHTHHVCVLWLCKTFFLWDRFFLNWKKKERKVKKKKKTLYWNIYCVFNQHIYIWFVIELGFLFEPFKSEENLLNLFLLAVKYWIKLYTYGRYFIDETCFFSASNVAFFILNIFHYIRQTHNIYIHFIFKNKIS